MMQCINNKVLHTMPIFLSLGLITSAPLAHASSSYSYQMQQYIDTIKQASNSKNIDKLSSLIANEAMIKIDRKNKSATLNKNGYLSQVQKNWQTGNEYNYRIKASHVIKTGNQIKANIVTTETFNTGKDNITYVTDSQATLAHYDSKLMLVKSVSKVTIK